MLELHTRRLRLLSLTEEQLRCYLSDTQRLEQALGLPLSRAILGDPVPRAIGMKLDKMARAAESQHPWYSYWLVVVTAVPFGAGLAGFKGEPDSRGQVEIGYGIDRAYEGRGYTTEAVRALLAWAFKHPPCRAVVAPNTLKSNPGSNRILSKVGMSVYEESDLALSWRITRTQWQQAHG